MSLNPDFSQLFAFSVTAEVYCINVLHQKFAGIGIVIATNRLRCVVTPSLELPYGVAQLRMSEIIVHHGDSSRYDLPLNIDFLKFRPAISFKMLCSLRNAIFRAPIEFKSRLYKKSVILHQQSAIYDSCYMCDYIWRSFVGDDKNVEATDSADYLPHTASLTNPVRTVMSV